MSIDFNVIPFPAPEQPQPLYDRAAILASLQITAYRWVPELFPQGVRKNGKLRVADITGRPPRKEGSCEIDLNGDHAGSYRDWSNDQHGDAVATIADHFGVKGLDALKKAFEIAQQYGRVDGGHKAPEPKRSTSLSEKHLNEAKFELGRSVPAAGTLVETYFAARGLQLPATDDLRFGPDCTHWETKSAKPTLLAVIRYPDGRPTGGIHRIYLKEDGSWHTGDKMMLGPADGGVIQLAPVPEDGTLGLAEGIETATAAMQLTGIPCWSTLTAGGMRKLAASIADSPPPNIKRLIIFADTGRDGETAAAELRAAAAAAGINAEVRLPRGGDDFNDDLQNVLLPVDGSQYAPQTWQPEQRAQTTSGRNGTPSVAELAALDPIEYDRQREAVAKLLGCRLSTLDGLVEKERMKSITVGAAQLPGRELRLRDPDPWHDAVNGEELLKAITGDMRRYVIMTPHQASAVALWVLATHSFNSFVVFPRLFFSAQAPNCGKTTALEVVTNLVPRAMNASSISAAATYRVIQQARPSLMLDEADSFMRDNEDLRGVINAGHRRDGSIVRCVETSEGYEPREFSAWAPVALAAIGHLPNTIEDRSIIIKLARKLESDQIESLRIDRTDHLSFRTRCAARWAQDNADALAAADPRIPAGIINRAADNWRPLLAVADLAGGIWPDLARDVAVELCSSGGPKSISELLLEDLHELFETVLSEGGKKPTELFTREILQALHDRDERPWSEFGKDRKPITGPQIAAMLRKLGVKKVGMTVRRGDETAKGYRRESLDEAFTRYL